jgi:release factor glutamine methyltransferase
MSIEVVSTQNCCVKHMRIEPGDTVLDVCTGTGVVALKAAEAGASRVTGTDLNPAAIDNATKNQRLLNIINVRFVEADLFSDSAIHYDVITTNPPFTNWRAPDKTALCFWNEDNRVINRFFAQLRYYLKPSGRAYVAWASYGDQQLLPMLAQQNDMRLELLGSQTSPAGFGYYAYRLTFIRAECTVSTELRVRSSVNAAPTIRSCHDCARAERR